MHLYTNSLSITTIAHSFLYWIVLKVTFFWLLCYMMKTTPLFLGGLVYTAIEQWRFFSIFHHIAQTSFWWLNQILVRGSLQKIDHLILVLEYIRIIIKNKNNTAYFMYTSKYYLGLHYIIIIAYHLSTLFCYNFSFWNVMIVDTNTEILIILKHYFKLDLKAIKAAHRIQEAKSNSTAQNWLKY